MVVISVVVIGFVVVCSVVIARLVVVSSTVVVITAFSVASRQKEVEQSLEVGYNCHHVQARNVSMK